MKQKAAPQIANATIVTSSVFVFICLFKRTFLQWLFVFLFFVGAKAGAI